MYIFRCITTRTIQLFFILGFLFIPLTFLGLEFQKHITDLIFSGPVLLIQDNFFPSAIDKIDLSSDTTSLNILFALLLLISLSTAILLEHSKFEHMSINIRRVFNSIAPYYVSCIFLKYGFDKVFKLQFYMPEPNILYTHFGNLTKDTLYWSTIGTSYTYSLITGIIEIFVAGLILYKPTRLLGFLFSITVLLNILLINFSFDISVKAFSGFLLLSVVCYVSPYLKKMYIFFIKQEKVQLRIQTQAKTITWANIVLGTTIIGLVIFPYLSAGNFNDDKAERPALHGAYEITQFLIGTDTLKHTAMPYKKVFFHRDHFLIFQGQDDKMVDFHYDIDPLNKRLVLQDYHKAKVTVYYDDKPGFLKLSFNNSEKWVVLSKSLDWKNLPALQDEMHYTIDEIK